jgi:ribosomal protein L37AE/L43A
VSAAPSSRGVVYRCPVCGAELTVVARRTGVFAPRCCNQPMQPRPQRLAFYACPVCGSELVVVRQGPGEFTPRCCNRLMAREAA